MKKWLKRCHELGVLNAKIAALPLAIREFILYYWPIKARAEQIPDLSGWTNWLLLGGRGAGKTRAGAEWVNGVVRGDVYFSNQPVGRLALVGETYSSAREVMVEGPSGILAVSAAGNRPVWVSSRRRLEWPNGSVAQVFSSEDPDALRGPQFGAAWCDELAKWSNAQATWDMLQFGLRLGSFPRQVITTTPRPLKLLKDIVADRRSLVTRMTTEENRSNLSEGFFDRIVSVYRGTRLGRQEIEGEIIEDLIDALWQRDGIELRRCLRAPELARTVVAVDPPITGTAQSDACGIVVAALGKDQRAYVLEDKTLAAVSPAKWAQMVVQLYKKYDADRIVVETNQGGDMVESVLRSADATLSIRQVKASRGKWLRAEPVAHLYERGLVSHVGALPDLEDEMCNFGLNGMSNGRSPDRLDALVWALTDLLLQNQSFPRARSF